MRFLLIIMVSAMVCMSVKPALAQQSERIEISATIQLPSNVIAGTTFAELNFSTSYAVSIYLYANQSTISLEQGVLAMGIPGNVTQAKVYDNLGNVFSPIINQTKIVTPEISGIAVSSGSLYILTLNYTTKNAVFFDNSSSAFQWGLTITNGEYPMSVHLNLPQDFSSIKTTLGANETSEGLYKEITWNVQPHEKIDCRAQFLPFTIQPTVTSIRLTSQVMSNNNVNSAIRMIFNESYYIKGSFLIWNVSLNLPIKVPFPENSSTDLSVQSVTDGVNNCKEQASPLSPGKYLIDYQNNAVEVLPRDTYQNNVSERFDVQVVFMVHNLRNYNETSVNIPFYKPYESLVILAFNLSSWGIFIPNLELFQAKIILPSGVDHVSGQTGNPMQQGSVDTGYIVTYNYDNPSPSSIPSLWTVTFEYPQLRVFFYQQLDTIILFFALFLFSVGFYWYLKKRKIKIVGKTVLSLFVSEGFTLYLIIRVIDSWTTYQSFNNLDLLFTVFLAIESAFAVIVPLVLASPLIQKVRSSSSSPPLVEENMQNDKKSDNINCETNNKNE